MKPQTTKKLFAFILIAIGMFSFSFLPAKDCAVLNGRKSFNQIAVKSPNEPTPVSLTTTTIATIAPAVKIGSYTASAELGTSGTYVMRIEFFGQAFHCTTTFSPIGGDEFTLFSECEMTLLRGQWRAISGTGVYANLEGNGSIIMLPGHEYCTGRVF